MREEGFRHHQAEFESGQTMSEGLALQMKVQLERTELGR